MRSYRPPILRVLANIRERTDRDGAKRDNARDAERYLAEQEARIANQRKLIDRLEADGHSTREAVVFLEKMYEIRVEMQEHRDFIRDSPG